MATDRKVSEKTLECFRSIVIHTEERLSDDSRKEILSLTNKESIMRILNSYGLDEKYNKIWTAIKCNNDDVYLIGRASIR